MGCASRCGSVGRTAVQSRPQLCLNKDSSLASVADPVVDAETKTVLPTVVDDVENTNSLETPE